MSLVKKPVTGMKDILPAEMQLRDYAIGIIKKTYGEFGFTSIETPAVESLANLITKRLIYIIRMIKSTIKQSSFIFPFFYWGFETLITNSIKSSLTLKVILIR